MDWMPRCPALDEAIVRYGRESVVEARNHFTELVYHPLRWTPGKVLVDPECGLDAWPAHTDGEASDYVENPADLQVS